MRKQKEQKIEDLVSLEHVRGLLATKYWRRRFLAHRAARQAERAPAGGFHLARLFSMQL